MDESYRDKFQQQLDELREQGRTDSEFHSLMWRELRHEMLEMGAEFSEGLREIGRKVEAVSQRIDRRIDHFVANHEERMRQIEGRQRLKEQRFDTILRGVATKEELEALKERVRRLEEAS